MIKIYKKNFLLMFTNSNPRKLSLLMLSINHFLLLTYHQNYNFRHFCIHFRIINWVKWDDEKILSWFSFYKKTSNPIYPSIYLRYMSVRHFKFQVIGMRQWTPFYMLKNISLFMCSWKIDIPFIFVQIEHQLDTNDICICCS